MLTTDWFGVLALLISGISPAGVVLYSHHARRVDKKRERERIAQEEGHRVEVAAEALKIAKDLVADGKRLNQETRERVSEITGMFPNGHLTAALQRELATCRSALSSMLDVVHIKEANGITVPRQTYKSIEAMETQLQVLTEQIKERLPAH